MESGPTPEERRTADMEMSVGDVLALWFSLTEDERQVCLNALRDRRAGTGGAPYTDEEIRAASRDESGMRAPAILLFLISSLIQDYPNLQAREDRVALIQSAIGTLPIRPHFST